VHEIGIIELQDLEHYLISAFPCRAFMQPLEYF